MTKGALCRSYDFPQSLPIDQPFYTVLLRVAVSPSCYSGSDEGPNLKHLTLTVSQDSVLGKRRRYTEVWFGSDIRDMWDPKRLAFVVRASRPISDSPFVAVLCGKLSQSGCSCTPHNDYQVSEKVLTAALQGRHVLPDVIIGLICSYLQQPRHVFSVLQ